MKYAITTLGCKVNQFETQAIETMLRARGHVPTSAGDADAVIVNTCAFLQSAREEAIETVLECADYKNGNLEKLVVTGCLPQKFIGELFAPLQEVDVFLGINDYEKIFEALENS